ncbi:MAG: hypothetical protein AMJ53_13185 [Gammaproteobacteria bacterium SG8_11]|nr:MAG: hypothetical protein AMJ53_13185 [Gammaproteobacteria bacterium SG8_11]
MDAKTAIGEYEPEDWLLDPQQHAARMAPEAGPLQRILQGAAPKVIIEQYEKADAEAGKYQNDYKRIARLEIYLSSIAAIIGAIVLYLASEATSTSDIIRQGLLLVQVLCIAGSVAAKYQIHSNNSFINWQQSRTAAETARIELFETVCGLRKDSPKETAQGDELPLLPLQLEYFLRYQLRVQLNYYNQRGEQHKKAARQYVTIGSAITFIATVGASLGGMAADFGDWVSVAALAGLVAPVLLAAQTSLSRLNQDERNAARYAITHRHLQNYEKKADTIREFANADNVDGVHAYIRSVNELISVEHKEWMEQQMSGTATTTSENRDPA